MEIGQIAGLGIIGSLIAFALSFFTNKAQGVGANTEDNGGTKEVSGLNAYNRVMSERLTQEQVFYIAQEIARFYGGRIDPLQLLTFAEIESSFRPYAERYEPHINDSSVGLMQTLVATAQEMYGRGYNRFGKPTKETLKSPVVSMYFGAAYIDWLQKAYPNKNLEWYVRAYNGGPGHNYNSMTTNYWSKWSRAFKRVGGGTGIGIVTG